MDGAALSDLDLCGRPRLSRSSAGACSSRCETRGSVKGTLYQVTQDGVILDQSGAKFGISYTRVSAIEADTAPEPA